MSADHQTLIAEALSGHRELVFHGPMWKDACWKCTCGETFPPEHPQDAIRAHMEHQAAALLDSPEFAAVLADVRAGVLREAASEWTQGAWIDIDAGANEYAEWLEDRADREGER